MPEMKTLTINGSTYEIVDETARNNAATPSDWNQNDETAIDYVKNRTHWTDDPVEAMFVAEQTVDVSDTGNAELEASAEFTEGETYTVTFNGTTHECVAKYGKTRACVYLGNGNFVEETTEDTHPFAIGSYSNGSCYLHVITSGQYAVSVSGFISEVHKIEEKYLPRLVGRNVDGTVYTVDGEEVTAQEGAEIFNNYNGNIASGMYSHAEGCNTIASGNRSHAEGSQTIASALGSHSEGYDTVASGTYSHAEGASTSATNHQSHAEGASTVASGIRSHAEGYKTIASGSYSHAEGHSTKATATDDAVTLSTSTSTDKGYYTHAEGFGSVAYGAASHAEGNGTKASGSYSHSEGHGTTANSESQHAQGKYNIKDDNNVYAHIVGNGTADANSNAHTLDWDGNAWFAGDVYVGSTSGTNKDDGSKKLVTVDEMNAVVADEVRTSIEDSCGEALSYKNANLAMPSSAQWQSVAYGNGKFVAITYSSNSIAAYSNDGITWRETSLPNSATAWRSVTYGNNRFVAVSNTGVGAYSDDGITWEETDLSDHGIALVTYGDGKFVAIAGVTTSSKIAKYSTDGVTWDTVELPTSAKWYGLTYGNGKFVATAASSTACVYSTDGITWSTTSLPTTGWWEVAYGNGAFVAVHTSGQKTLAYSTDGITWTSVNYTYSGYPDSIAFAGGLFLITYGNYGITYSEDGINWTRHSTSINPSGNVGYGNGVFVAIPSNISNLYTYSTDGINWIDSIEGLFSASEGLVTEKVRNLIVGAAIGGSY